MPKLLRVDVSARGINSVSRAVTDSFEAEWLTQVSGSEVIARDLAVDPVPHVPAEIVPRSTGDLVTSTAARFQDALVDELVGADAVVISTPMYNLGIPSALKAWIDHIVLHGRTLLFHGDPPPTAGLPITVITAFGGGYGPGAPREGWDHVKPYLEAVFGGILRMDVGFVGVEFTLAESTPGMEALTDLARHSLVSGHDNARARAVDVAHAIAGRAALRAS